MDFNYRTRQWWESGDTVLAFAHTLETLDLFQDIKEALYYFEKPWKWDAHREVIMALEEEGYYVDDYSMWEGIDKLMQWDIETR